MKKNAFTPLEKAPSFRAKLKEEQFGRSSKLLPNFLTGFTVLELLVVIIIIGILSAIALPTFTARIERTRGERAIANIELIASALKMYYIRQGNEPTLSNLAGINSTLNLELSDSHFSYEVNNSSPDHIIATYNSDTTKHIQYALDLSDGNPDGWDYNNSTWNSKWMP